MKIKNSILEVYKNATSHTEKAYLMGLSEGEFSLQLQTTDYLYFGYKNAINQIFIELKTPNTVANTLTIEQHNGSTWETLTSLDQTFGLTRSGFIYLDEDENKGQKVTVNSKNLVWYRLKTSANTSTMTCAGLNTLFCSTSDLLSLEPSVVSWYPRGSSSHILSLKAARDEVVYRINASNPGTVYDLNDPRSPNVKISVMDFTQWHVLDISEVKEIAVYYALYCIFSNRYDGTQDSKFAQERDKYQDLYEKKFQLWSGRKVTLDLNEDGKISDAEKSYSVRNRKAIR